MRVLIVNKYFYPRGGDCVVAMGTRDLLIDAGHKVQVFAMTHPQNVNLPESQSFASQIEFTGSPKQKVKAFRRLLGFGDITTSFKSVLDSFKPDIVHVHNIHSYLSPVICRIAHERGIPVVWTLHDFKLVCPAYTFRRNDGSICDFSATGKCSLIKNRCLKGSYVASFMAFLEASRWSMNKLNDMTDAFIAPSSFMSDMMNRCGYSPTKIHVIYNFIDPTKLNLLEKTSKDTKTESHFFAYTGRLSKEKGVETLIKAAIKANVCLKIAGDGPMRSQLEAMAAGYDNISFLGKLSSEDVARLQIEADACVCPSEWFENNPLAVIESLCAGTPVIGANIGGIPELIIPGKNGLLHNPGDTDTLADILYKFDPKSFDPASIAKEAVVKFSTHRHMSQLLSVYQSCIR